jgi:hypothetical protein
MRAMIQRTTVLFTAIVGTIGAGFWLVCDSGLAQETISRSASVEQLNQWSQDLAADSYHVREQATGQLRRAGVVSVPSVSAAMATADMEVVQRAARILTEIAMLHSPDADGGAWNALESMSQRGIGLPASRSRQALAEIREQRSEIAKDRLVKAGASIKYQELVVLSTTRRIDTLTLVIDDAFQGSPEDLAWLRWLDGIRHVCLIGSAVNQKIVEPIAKLPGLQTLILRDSSADADLIRHLMKASKLQNLEFQYVELAPEAGNLLADVPVRIGLSLNGTGLKQSQVDAIAKKTPGLIIEFKQGGFLGVIAASPNDCMIGEVQRGSAAENAGLTAGDVIVQINDRKVETFDELREEISKHLAGDVLKIVFIRGDHLGNSQTMETPLTLGRQPSPSSMMPR